VSASNEPAAEAQTRDQPRSLSIAFAVIDAIAAGPDSGPSAVARQVGISKSTASSILRALAERGVLEHTGSGRYRLGLRMFEYGHLALNQASLFEVGVPVLERLRDRVRDLVQLGVPVGAEILYLDRLESQTLDTRFHGTWRRLPGHASSSGRAIAAFNPEFTQTIFDAGFKRWTRYTEVEPQRLLAALAEVRSVGYSLTADELEEGIASLAAPVMLGAGANHRAIASVSVVGPSDRIRRERIGLATHVRRAAEDIGARLAEALARPVSARPGGSPLSR
jgi:DNA-binding IclR family transcriptional regulator